MHSFLRKVFNIYPGEGGKTFTFAALGFFWAFALSCGVTLFDGLFLENIGAAYLPKAYTVNSLSQIFISCLLIYALNKQNIEKIFFSMITTSLFGYLIVLGALLTSSTSLPIWIWFVYKVLSNVSLVFLGSAFFAFSDQFFDLQDAKRIYALLLASVFFGAICSGGMIAQLITYLGVAGFVALIASSLLCALGTTRYIQTAFPIVHDEAVHYSDSPQPIKIKTLLRQIVTSKFILYLLFLNFFAELVWNTTEFNYFSFYENHFRSLGENSEFALIEFVGGWRAWIAAGKVLVGALIYGRVIKRIGINNAVLIPYILFVAVYALWIPYPSLTVAILGMVAAEGFLHCLGDNNLSLLLNVTSPKIKNHLRVIIETGFEPLGMLMTAGILEFTSMNPIFLGSAAAALALATALALRANYFETVLNNLSRTTITFGKKLQQWIAPLSKKEKIEIERKLLHNIDSAKEDHILATLEISLATEKDPFVLSVLALTSSLPSENKQQVIKTVSDSSYAAHPKVIETWQAWCQNTKDKTLLGSLYFALAKEGDLPLRKALQLLKSDHIELFGAGVLALETTTYSSLKQATSYKNQARKHLAELVESIDEERLSMGIHLQGHLEDYPEIDLLLPYLEHPAIAIKRAAAKTMSQLIESDDTVCGPKLIKQITNINDKEFRKSSLLSLKKIINESLLQDLLLSEAKLRSEEKLQVLDMVSRNDQHYLPFLLELVKDSSKDHSARILAARCLGKISIKELKDILFELISPEIGRAHYYYYSAHTLLEKYPSHDLTLLKECLLTSFNHIIDFIIHLLSTARSTANSELLTYTLRSKNEKIHSQAVETLEKTCDRKIFRLLEPLIDDRPKPEKIKSNLSYHPELHNSTLEEVLDVLQSSNFTIDHMISATTQAKLGMPNWQNKVKEYLETRDEMYHHFAKELLTQ